MMGPVVGGPFVVVVAVMNGWFGWRSALILLGIGMLVVGIPLGMVARSRPEKYGMLPDGDTQPRTGETQSASQWGTTYGADDGMTVAEAVATREFWLLMVLFASMFMGISGLMVHLIPMMEDMGCLLYTSPSPRDGLLSRMPSSA